MEKEHAYCNECGRKIRKDIVDEDSEWIPSDRGWLCPADNPETITSWGKKLDIPYQS